MLCRYVVVVLVAVLGSSSSEEQGKRQARNPALLHLGHAGQPVGDYTGSVAPRGVAPGAGGGGPHIVILGGQPAHVSSHVAGKDSLEELDQELQQHYGRLQGSGVRYVPNSSNQGHYLTQGRQTLGYAGSGGLSAETAYNEARPRTPIAYTLNQGLHSGLNSGVNYGYAPLVYSPAPAQGPQGGNAYSHTGVSAYVNHPLQSPQGGSGAALSHYPAQAVTPSALNYGAASFYSGLTQGVTPSPLNYAPTHYATATPAPVSYVSPYTATPSPVTHTVASPVVSQAAGHRVPSPVAGAGFHSLRYPSPINQGPIFVPVRTLSHQPQFQGHGISLGRAPSVSYSPSLQTEGPARANSQYDEYRSTEDERPRYFADTQEKRPDFQGLSYQRDYSSERGFPTDNSDFDKTYSDEGLAKSAGSASYQSAYPDDKTSFEDSSSEAVSGERSPSLGNSGTFKYSFGDDHRTGGRSYGGDGKVATSYQSVTFETNSSPRYHGSANRHQ